MHNLSLFVSAHLSVMNCGVYSIEEAQWKEVGLNIIVKEFEQLSEWAENIYNAVIEVAYFSQYLLCFTHFVLPFLTNDSIPYQETGFYPL